MKKLIALLLCLLLMAVSLPVAAEGEPTVVTTVASATTFAVTPFVLLAICTGVLLATAATLNTLKKTNQHKTGEENVC